jgi:D-apionolactonase
MGEAHTLRAGPLAATFSAGELRHVRLGGAEVAQRIYVAVRDRNWGTTPGRLENVSLHVGSREFRIVFDSIHQQGSVDFRWRGTLTGTESGSISFTMDGKAHSTFLRNRIGFCVHHPLRESAGKPCVIETADGELEPAQFPEFVSPHQPFLNVRAITHEIAPGVRAEVRFLGEVFETEDHRNWTDANFKTYGTPLRLPFPVEVLAGTEVRQRVLITLQGASGTPEPLHDRMVRLRIADASGSRLPRIGLGMASEGRPLSRTELEALRRLKLSHLRVDLPLRGDWRPELELAAAEARAIGAKLEVGVTLPGDTRHLRDWTPVVDRWLVYRETEKATGAAAACELRAALGPEVFLAVGTKAYFAELNRNRPVGDGWDAACFSVNPQVHAFDDESVMANASAQFDAVRSARRFLGGRPVVVSPVTLRPRFNPDATGKVEPMEPDPRQKLPFCAAWTLASLTALARAGSSSVTYFETRGAGGVLDGGELYPVFRVLEAAGEFAGASVIACECSDESRVAALALECEGRRRMLIANLTSEPCEIAVAGHSEALNLEPYAITRLDREES